MGCGTTTIKYLLFFFNLIFAIGGLAILAVGALIQWSITSYDEFLDNEAFAPAIILIIAGSAIFVIAFFGCCGAVRESHCMVVTFAVMLLAIFIVQVIGGVLAFVYHGEFETELRRQMTNNMLKYKDNDDAGERYKESWDSTQKNLECCGIDNYTDWSKIAQIPTPISCNCFANSTAPCENGVFSEGCFPKLRNFMKNSEVALGAIALGVAFVELIGIIFACTLAKAIKNQRL